MTTRAVELQRDQVYFEVSQLHFEDDLERGRLLRARFRELGIDYQSADMPAVMAEIEAMVATSNRTTQGHPPATAVELQCARQKLLRRYGLSTS